MTSLDWNVGFSRQRDAEPVEWVPAKVPGAVQLDWARAHDWPDHNAAKHFEAYAWMEDVYWRYRAALPPAHGDGRTILKIGGVDYRFQVLLDGRVLLDQEGMFTPVELDLTEVYAPGLRLEVLVWPAPKREGAPPDRSQADRSVKPAVSYGWDWHPRLIPLGIWQEAGIDLKPSCYIKRAETLYTLDAERTSASVTVDIALNQPAEGTLDWTLTDPSGNVAASAQVRLTGESAAVIRAEVFEPALWWPNGAGAQALYTSHAVLKTDSGEDSASSRIGFRTLTLEQYPGAWYEPSDFPKTRSNPPVKAVVNGRPIFLKGTNWVNPEIFPGIIDRDTYRAHVDLARDAHFNVFRIWGGGIVNKDDFFDLCDEAGILVWQEFPLACNNYVGDPSYLKVLDAESRSIIRRLRSRASLAIWCGGNELFNGWSGMTEQSLPLRLLNRNCYDLDPGHPFLYTSPLMGMAHGCYLFRYPDGREVYQVMPSSSFTAYTEFGVPSPASAETLKSIIPPDELFPPAPGGSWEAHHAYGAWDGGGFDTWLCLEMLTDYFGPIDSLEQLVHLGQWTQAEGYKCIYEEARRQSPRCSMAVNWCYQEPWPTAANNALLEYPATPKPAYHAVRASCRPRLNSARISKFQWRAGESFDPELFLLNDSETPIPPGRMDAVLELDGTRVIMLSWDHSGAPAGENLRGPKLHYTLPNIPNADRLTLRLSSPGRDELESEYTLSYRAGEE